MNINQLKKDQIKSKKTQSEYQISISGKGVDFDWSLLLFLGFFTVILFTAFSYYKSLKINQEVINHQNTFGNNSVESQIEFDNQSIESLIKIYESRKEVLNNFE